jgi:hypothetical protein
VLRRLPVREAEKDQFGAREVIPSGTIVELAARAMKPRVIGALLRRDRRGAYLRIARNSLRSRLSKSYRDAHREGLARPSDRLLTDVSEFLVLGIPLLLIAGTDDPGADAFQRAMSTELGEVLGTAQSLVETRVLVGNVSATDNVVIQESVIDLTAEWLSGLFAAPVLKEKWRA